MGVAYSSPMHTWVLVGWGLLLLLFALLRGGK